MAQLQKGPKNIQELRKTLSLRTANLGLPSGKLTVRELEDYHP